MTVVVLRALGLGDLLTALPALRGLAAAFPEHRRILAAPSPLAPLAMLSGAVDAVVPATGLAPLPTSLYGAEIAVNLHGRGPQSHGVLARLEPDRLIAFASDEAGVSGPKWRDDEHEVARWCRMLRAHGIPCDPTRLDLPPPRGPAVSGGAGITLVHPGAGSPARRWPPERFAAVARSEREMGHQVIVTGGRDEVELARRVAAEAELPPSAVRAGRIDALGLYRIVGSVDRVVCGDTGVAHLATAVGTPSVVLFGPTPPALWGPPPGRRRHRVLWAGTTGDPHADTPDPGLLSITVDEVVAALRTLPGREPAAPRRRGAGAARR